MELPRPDVAYIYYIYIYIYIYSSMSLWSCLILTLHTYIMLPSSRHADRPRPAYTRRVRAERGGSRRGHLSEGAPLWPFVPNWLRPLYNWERGLAKSGCRRVPVPDTPGPMRAHANTATPADQVATASRVKVIGVTELAFGRWG